MMKNLQIITLLLIGAISSICYSQKNELGNDFEIKRSKLEVNRTEHIAKNLTISDELATIFWPLHQEYRDAVKGITEKTLDMIKLYASDYNQDMVSNKKAMHLMTEFLELDRQRIELKALYMKKFTVKLPAKLVWRYFHISNNLDTMVRYSYISQIPIVKL